MTRNRKLKRPTVKKKTRRSKKRNKREFAEKNKKQSYWRTGFRIAQTSIILAFLSGPVFAPLAYLLNQLLATASTMAMQHAITLAKGVALHYAM